MTVSALVLLWFAIGLLIGVLLTPTCQTAVRTLFPRRRNTPKPETPAERLNREFAEARLREVRLQCRLLRQRLREDRGF